ncbi:hypothetical protein PE36_13519 [Moritella sp. PE36]|uniref:intermembrane phospholipid transport protein YdbH family protein n=1 Tax=Moritella sp. PE36 TaxID=58051 RepID=UPI0001569CB9|nr:YdbH domain-containing protein [Moritella sp. PE36]EDM64783.1 hypothetical protein PE36_13519 [Moritella sp. PE36]
MSASNNTNKKTTKSSNKLRTWILSLLILMLSSVAVTLVYRERIIVGVTNHFAAPYGVKVATLNGLAVQFDLQQPFFIKKVTLAQLELYVDYLQFEKTTQGQTNQAATQTAITPLSLPELPNWIPDLHITNIAVQGSSLPKLNLEQLHFQDNIFKVIDFKALDLNSIAIKDIDFKYMAGVPEFGFSVWQAGRNLLEAKLNYIFDNNVDSNNVDRNNVDNQAFIKAQLTTDLTNISSIVNKLLPDLNTTIVGTATLETRFDPQLIDNVAVKLSFSNLGMSHNQQAMIANADVIVDTVLVLEGIDWLPEHVNLNIAHIDPINLTADTCAPYTQLFNIDKTACQSFNKEASPTLAPIVITPELPLSLQLSIQESDIQRWQVQAKQLGMKVQMLDKTAKNSVVVKAQKLQLTPQSWLSDWSFAMITNSHYVSDIHVPVQLNAQGHIDVNPTESAMNIKVTVNEAAFTAQKFNYMDISSEDIQVALLAPMTVNIDKGEVRPFDFALSTALFNTKYQHEYKLERLTAQHQGRFSAKTVSVSSDWQLDDVVLKSKNTIKLFNLAPHKLEGKWQFPKQTIPSLITDIYPLPVGLNLPARVTNRLEYQVMLNGQERYLTASMSGGLTADHSTFNEITATDINATWMCSIVADKPDLATSLNAKCNINSDISSVDMGPVTTDVNFSGLVSFADEKLQVVVDNASAKAFSGTISVSPLLITDFDHIVGQLQVRNLSLPEVLELYNVPGVKVTGLLKADLPFIVQGAGISITDGSIEQQGAGGVIQIKDNVTIDQLKLTQPQLRYALELLENLHYDSLHSDIDYKPSGDTKLTINIKGHNPSVAQPIEFNYSHEENVLQLFRSLRINDALYDALDKMNHP